MALSANERVQVEQMLDGLKNQSAEAFPDELVGGFLTPARKAAYLLSASLKEDEQRERVRAIGLSAPRAVEAYQEVLRRELKTPANAKARLKTLRKQIAQLEKRVEWQEGMIRKAVPICWQFYDRIPVEHRVWLAEHDPSDRDGKFPPTVLEEAPLEVAFPGEVPAVVQAQIAILEELLKD